MCIAGYDYTGNGVLELVVGWSNGKVDIRNQETGDVLCKTMFGSHIAGIVTVTVTTCTCVCVYQCFKCVYMYNVHVYVFLLVIGITPVFFFPRLIIDWMVMKNLFVAQ